MDIMDGGKSLIAQLEDAIKSGSTDKRVDTMRRITDLFVGTADRLNEQQVELFDSVLGRLISKIEGTAIAELSARLGPIGNAPLDVVQKLARHDDIAVAEPIMTHSPRLGDKDLIEIAHSKTQAHLLAISGRAQIGTTVTDALLQRGDYDVFHKLAENNGANFSDLGFTTLVKHSESDPHLAENRGPARYSASPVSGFAGACHRDRPRAPALVDRSGTSPSRYAHPGDDFRPDAP
jgi:uncharacterized protein (DUF2336 family)